MGANWQITDVKSTVTHEPFYGADFSAFNPAIQSEGDAREDMSFADNIVTLSQALQREGKIKTGFRIAGEYGAAGRDVVFAAKADLEALGINLTKTAHIG